MEFAAQLATLGLKRGLAQQLSTTDQPHGCVVRTRSSPPSSPPPSRPDPDALPAGDVPDQRDPRRRLAAADGHLRHRRRRHRPRRARLPPRYRRDGPRPRDRRAVDDQHRRRRLRSDLPGGGGRHPLARRADHRLCDLGDGGADRVAVAALPQLRPAPRAGSRTRRSSSTSPAATSRSPPPTRSNGARAGSTSPSSACSSRPIGSESIMSASRSPRCRRS